MSEHGSFADYNDSGLGSIDTWDGESFGWEKYCDQIRFFAAKRRLTNLFLLDKATGTGPEKAKQEYGSELMMFTLLNSVKYHSLPYHIVRKCIAPIDADEIDQVPTGQLRFFHAWKLLKEQYQVKKKDDASLDEFTLLTTSYSNFKLPVGCDVRIKLIELETLVAKLNLVGVTKTSKELLATVKNAIDGQSLYHDAVRDLDALDRKGALKTDVQITEAWKTLKLDMSTLYQRDSLKKAKKDSGGKTEEDTTTSTSKGQKKKISKAKKDEEFKGKSPDELLVLAAHYKAAASAKADGGGGDEKGTYPRKSDKDAEGKGCASCKKKKKKNWKKHDPDHCWDLHPEIKPDWAKGTTSSGAEGVPADKTRVLPADMTGLVTTFKGGNMTRADSKIDVPRGFISLMVSVKSNMYDDSNPTSLQALLGKSNILAHRQNGNVISCFKIEFIVDTGANALLIGVEETINYVIKKRMIPNGSSTTGAGNHQLACSEVGSLQCGLTNSVAKYGRAEFSNSFIVPGLGVNLFPATSDYMISKGVRFRQVDRKEGGVDHYLFIPGIGNIPCYKKDNDLLYMKITLPASPGQLPPESSPKIALPATISPRFKKGELVLVRNTFWGTYGRKPECYKGTIVGVSKPKDEDKHSEERLYWDVKFKDGIFRIGDTELATSMKELQVIISKLEAPVSEKETIPTPTTKVTSKPSVIKQQNAKVTPKPGTTKTTGEQLIDVVESESGVTEETLKTVSDGGVGERLRGRSIKLALRHPTSPNKVLTEYSNGLDWKIYQNETRTAVSIDHMG